MFTFCGKTKMEYFLNTTNISLVLKVITEDGESFV